MARGREYEYDSQRGEDCVALAKLRGDMESQFAAMQPLLQQALEGVANFRKHSARANTYFDRAEAVLEADEKRRNNAWKRYSVYMLILCAALAYPIDQGWHLFVDVVKLTEEWKSYTPVPSPVAPDGQPAPKVQHKSFWDHQRSGVRLRESAPQTAGSERTSQ